MCKEWKILSIALSIGLIATLAGCTSARLPSGPDAAWDLVIIGDSSMWELGEAYAAQIEKDQGVDVNLEDFALPNLSAGEVLTVLETGKSANARLEKLPEALKNAEVVVMWVNPEDSVDLSKGMGYYSCFDSKNPGSNTCLLEDLEPFTTDLKAIWQHVIDLRDGQETILYATDLYNPLVARWQQNGAFDECTACWDTMAEASRLAAESYGIPFLSRLDVYNGPDRSEDPRLKGYIRDDGEHPTPLGAEATALKLSEMGYKPVIP